MFRVYLLHGSQKWNILLNMYLYYNAQILTSFDASSLVPNPALGADFLPSVYETAHRQFNAPYNFYEKIYGKKG